MGGTFDEASLVGVSAEYITSVVGKVGALGGGACTLLGPEGPGADRASRKAGGGWCLFLWASFVPAGWWVWRGFRPYFENYTVDASIFHATLRGCVVKMILKIISQFFDDSTHVISSL